MQQMDKIYPKLPIVFFAELDCTDLKLTFSEVLYQKGNLKVGF